MSKQLYNSIGHVPGSTLGNGDFIDSKVRGLIEAGSVCVQEKIDGACGLVKRELDGSLMTYSRNGYTCDKSGNMGLFHIWMLERETKFKQLLNPGEYAIGEWMANNHSVKYDIDDVDRLYVIFDIMPEIDTPIGKQPNHKLRASCEDVERRCSVAGLVSTKTLFLEDVSIDELTAKLAPMNDLGNVEAEGLVFRYWDKNLGSLIFDAEWKPEIRVSKWVKPGFIAGHRVASGNGRYNFDETKPQFARLIEKFYEAKERRAEEYRAKAKEASNK